MGFGRFSGKRGEVNEQILWVLGEIVFVTAWAVAGFLWVGSIEKDTLLEKNYLSRDLSLLIDAAYASPGSVEYAYSHDKIDVSDYNFILKNQGVKTAESGRGTPVFYWYADNLVMSDALDTEIRSPSSIKVCGTAGMVEAGRDDCTSLTRLQCPAVDTATDRIPIIMLNPVFGGSERGKTNADGTVFESEISRSIAYSLQQINSIERQFIIDSTRDLAHDLPPETLLSIDDRRALLEQRAYELLVTISIGDYVDGRNPVKSYMPLSGPLTLQNSKMGCIIANSLASHNIEVTSISMPIESIDILLNLKSNVVALVLQLGNIQNSESSLIADADSTARIIYDALKEYYGKT